MTYKECLDWLFSQLPMYQRVGSVAYKADLQNTLNLMELLQHPEAKFKSIHVGGTNGKGSVSHMLAAIFQSAGYKTGLYTSPHLKDFRERIRLNGKMISEKDVCSFVERYQKDFEAMQLSFFEMTVGMAFDYFAREEVDIAIVEVGMGGRLDSTNVLTPELSVITNIGLDHVRFLGDSKPLIAMEKAGIIKPGIPALIGEHQEETDPVFNKAAHKKGAPIFYAQDMVGWKDTEFMDLKGAYQEQNLRTVLAAVEILKDKYSIEKSVQKALGQVSSLTGLRGRWEQLGTRPNIICDTAHNEDGLHIVLDQIKRQSYRRLHMVWGMVDDKDSVNILNSLPKNAIYYFCKPDVPRGRNAEELGREAVRYGLSGKSYSSVKKALKAAKADAQPDDLIFIGGSTFVVAEVI